MKPVPKPGLREETEAVKKRAQNLKNMMRPERKFDQHPFFQFKSKPPPSAGRFRVTSL
jgi:hypothetical protein